MRKIVLSLSLIMSLTLSYAHKSYVSIANMEYNEKEEQIEVSLKLTAHDFEHILENEFNQRIHIENVADSSKIGLFIQKYIENHFWISSQKQKAIFSYVGKEVTVRDDLFFYFTFKQILDPLNITVSNSFLFGLFLKQQNIVHYKIKKKTKSVTLIPSIREEKISYK
jgi:hypothetical protein